MPYVFSGRRLKDRTIIDSQSASSPLQRPSAGVIVFAFAALYVLWGSTYLTIAIAIETIPPFLMAGTRFVTAGVLLFAFLRWRGDPTPLRAHWRTGFLTGTLLMLGGNGGVTWAEQYVASSVTALVIATTPLWAALLPWIFRKSPAPKPLIFGSIAVGLLGVGLLVWKPGNGHSQTEIFGFVAIVAATLSWATGSLWSRALPQPENPLMTCALQMLCGGGMQVLMSIVLGEWNRFDPAAISTRSLSCWVYLIFFGSIGGFGAFVFLLRWSSPARVFTYAYVNPLIAVFLGWLVLNEPIGWNMLAAAVLIVISVAMVVASSKK
jgi:drug/metabolite transporter (DMT)-like permease